MKKFTDLPSDSIASEPAVPYILSPIYNAEWSQSSLKVVHDARNGFTFGDLLILSKVLNLSLTDLTVIFNLSLRTLQRYDVAHKMDADASSKIIQLSILKEQGLSVFGNQSSNPDPTFAVTFRNRVDQYHILLDAFEVKC